VFSVDVVILRVLGFTPLPSFCVSQPGAFTKKELGSLNGTVNPVDYIEVKNDSLTKSSCLLEEK
jgi:hypothetical protein